MPRTVVTAEMIKQINELYLTIGTYAGVSRAMGGTPSPTTVKKYVVKDFVPTEEVEAKKKVFNEEIKPISLLLFSIRKNWGDVCKLSADEEEEIKELWEEMSI